MVCMYLSLPFIFVADPRWCNVERLTSFGYNECLPTRLFSGILQTTNGIMFVVLSFMLTMQSTDVIGLFLNLTGLIFLQEIDDWGFQLGCSGLLGRRVQKECDHVLDLKQLVPETMKKRIIYAKRAFLVLLTVGVLVPFGFIAGELYAKAKKNAHNHDGILKACFHCPRWTIEG